MQKLTLATLSALALGLTCSRVFAVDGTITVNGVVTDGTCILHSAGGDASGTKDLTLNLPTVPKSGFYPNVPLSKKLIYMELLNATGTGVCDVATSRAFKGIHLSVSSPPTDLDTEDKTLLVNKALDASTKNPIFFQITTRDGIAVDISEPWGTQAKSPVFEGAYAVAYLSYYVAYISKTAIVDAQNVHAVVNYTMHYN
ncbi:type 1 fimbrial protein [Acinetobacter sp. NyZ410]|uniref:fimbrial protein n=1 Tax=Acinetobacter sp. NyZ410 TaxID=2929509 RepID=UPI001FBAC191|nr:type 1 fimbrial protein [Acinetobacter sp. NyZ410]UOH17279.1 type 1 fimbrial protein [Acinetobacter sp. NyZ410]